MMRGREVQGGSIAAVEVSRCKKSKLAITRHAKERLVILSASEYRRLKRLDRQPLAVEELSDAELEAIRKAEPPAKAKLYDHELAAGDGADT